MHRLFVLGLVSVLLAVAAVSCRQGVAPPSVEPAVVLRTYQVPEGRGEELRGVVSRLLTQGEERLGKAELVPGGALAVVAPASLQGGISTLVERVGATKDGYEPRLELTYWILLARPATGAPATLPPELADVAKAIGEGQDVEIVEKLSLSCQSGAASQLHGQLVEIQQVASYAGGMVVGDLRLHVKGGSGPLQVATRLKANSGHMVVLAESGVARLQERDVPGGRILYVVRATMAG